MSEKSDDEKNSENLQKIDKLRHLIRLQLNPNDPHDEKIEKLIFEIPELTHPSKRTELKEKISELIEESQKLLKVEWERVKEESIRGDLKENEQALDLLFRKCNDFVVEKLIKNNKG